ncbi:MAG: hypothetical protein ACR2O4_15915, partial [Hyphomicrobiaceae bacterium]
MAQSDDPTVYSQAWRDGEQAHAAPAQPVYYDPSNPGAGYAEQGRYEGGYAQGQAMHPAPGQPLQGQPAPAQPVHDPYAASYDQHAAAPVTYGGEPQTQPQAQAYAGDSYATQAPPQQRDNTHVPPAGYDSQPVSQPPQYGEMQQPGYDAPPTYQAPRAQHYNTQPAMPPVAGHAADPFATPDYAQEQPAAYEDYNQQSQPLDAPMFGQAQPQPAAADTYAPMRYTDEGQGFTASSGSQVYSEFGQSQEPAYGQPQYGAAPVTHDPYAFPQQAPQGHDTLSHDPQGGQAYFDPLQFDQQQSMEPLRGDPAYDNYT